MPALSRRAVLALVAAAPAAAQAEATKQGISRATNLTGTYRVDGASADATTYTGTATITQQGDAVEITWIIGGNTFQGTGILVGRVLTVDWGDTTPVVYVVMPNGALHGTWADGTALDRLTPM